MRGANRRKFWALLLTGALLAFMLIGSTTAAGASNLASSRLAGDLGYLPLHPAAYAKAKADLDARAGVATDRQSGFPLLATGPSWQGVSQPNVTPPDPNGAVGPTRYVEMVNLSYAIYDRTNCSPTPGLGCPQVSSGSLQMLTGDFYISDPEVIWDPATQHFYFTLVDYIHDTIQWGFSKSDKPDVDGFCHYTADLGYGSNLPDYPRLGDTQNFLLIGANIFANFSIYLGSDVDWIQKATVGPITSCPGQASFAIGRLANLTKATPVPTVQTDTSTTGWVVSTPDVSTGNSASIINVFQVTETGSSISIGPAQSVGVPTFSMPASAPQCSSSRKLDTLDGRLERAVAAIDPAAGAMAIWTAHAVAVPSGVRAEERWYEIGVAPGTAPASPHLGKASDLNKWVWNGAISPDRAVPLTGSPSFGSDMVMGFNTSSPVDCSAIQMVSKVGTNLQSAFVLVHQSTGPNADFSCRNANSVCRWGDYSGASPDPAATTGGAVWLTGEWNVPNSNLDRAAWRTWNWEATP